MNKYFKDMDTLEGLRKQYKELLKKFHPDNAEGSTDITQAINAEYDILFRILKDRHEKNSGNDSRAAYDHMKYDFSEDAKLRKILQKIIAFTNLDIEIIGCWIWVGGSTFLYKKELKTIGFRWAGEKKKWYYHTEAFRKKSNKKLSMNDIRSYYGSAAIKPETKELLEVQQILVKLWYKMV